MKFTNPVEIAFDPTKLTGEMREVWDSTIARTIWLSWRGWHIVNQNFQSDVLMIAKEVKKYPPATVAELRKLVRSFFGIAGNFQCGSVEEWAEEAFPFVSGAEELRYVVESGGREHG